jgi:DUF4097 and DUF4098 domain-containing protein YvlB
MMKTRVLTALALLAFALTAVADVDKTEEMSFDVNPGARVSLENINGDISITGGSTDGIHVTAHKRAGTKEYLDGMEIAVDATGDYVRIETRHPKGAGSWFSWAKDSSGSISYELSVPTDVNLDSIVTVNGDVDVRSVSGKVKVSTVNGSIEANGLSSVVNLETVNGGISADFESLGQDQRVSAEAVNGKIVLNLPASASARIDAETVNGSIDAEDFGLEPEKGFVGRDLNGDIGGGDARISVNTVNGSIRIVKK